MKKTVWCLEDDRMGSLGQLKGLVQGMSEEKYKIVSKKIIYTWVAKLPNFIKGASLLGLDKESKKNLQESYPDLVISISRRTAPIARYIKNKSHGKTKIIQLMHPGNCGLKDFDLIVVPEHDRYKKETANMFYITGVLHRITEKTLSDAKELWEKEFASLPKPHVAVIIGGAIKGKPFGLDNAKALGHDIKEYIKKLGGGSILITTSRRTGSGEEKEILKHLTGIPAYKYLWGSTGVNPYMGFLACADKIVATGDSVSMCSESCGTGLPVFVFKGKNWLTPKHNRFVDSLVEGGYAAILGEDTNFKPTKTLNAVSDVVQKIEAL